MLVETDQEVEVDDEQGVELDDEEAGGRGGGWLQLVELVVQEVELLVVLVVQEVVLLVTGAGVVVVLHGVEVLVTGSGVVGITLVVVEQGVEMGTQPDFEIQSGIGHPEASRESCATV